MNRYGIFNTDTDIELNDSGRRQAELLGKRMQNYNIDIIYSSDLGRVAETTEIINAYTNTEIIFKEELREINMGAWETLSVEQRYINDEAYASEWHKHLEDLPYPNGECGRDVSRRAMRVIDEIKKKQYENVAIVTSGGTIKILLCEILGLEQYKRFNMQVDNCSISIVSYDIQNNKQIVKCINDTGHLENLIQQYGI